MPARFQMSHLPLNLPNTFCFLDDNMKFSTDVFEAGVTSVNIGFQNPGVENRIHCKKYCRLKQKNQLGQLTM